MTSQEVSTGEIARVVGVRLVAGVLVTVLLVVVVAGPQSVASLLTIFARAQLHPPRWELIAQASLAVRIHLATVAAALVLATLQMVGPKGRVFHRTLGWTLAVLLVVTAVAAMFIRNPQGACSTRSRSSSSPPWSPCPGA